LDQKWNEKNVWTKLEGGGEWLRESSCVLCWVGETCPVRWPTMLSPNWRTRTNRPPVQPKSKRERDGHYVYTPKELLLVFWLLPKLNTHTHTRERESISSASFLS
jgi:hypothetical protein